MANKFFLIILILISSCGRQVDINTSKLESYSKLSEEQINKEKVDAILFRLKSSDNIQYSGKSYHVSGQSSHLALSFIKSKSIGTNLNVRIKAKFKGTEVIIETIEAK